MANRQQKGISALEDKSKLDKIRDFMAEVAQKQLRASEAKQEAMQAIQPTAAQTAYIGSIFAPGAGTIDAAGNFPAFPSSDVALKDAFSGEPMPSMAENIKAGGIDRYLMAPLQGLGVAGDAAYGIPVAGPAVAGLLKTPAALATIAGGIAKASKAKKGITALDDTARLKKAKDMGFRTDEPVYHGTHSKDIDAFDDKFIGNRDEGFFGKGHYFTSESGEASYYGPNVGEYYTRGKLLDLSPTKKNSNFEIEDKDYFKFWTKELDKLDMLDEPTKIGLKTINKIDDYVEKNVKVINGQNSNGTTGFTASVKHPTREPYVFKDSQGKRRSIDETLDTPLFNRGDGVEFHATKEKAIKALKDRIIYEAEMFSEMKKVFPGLENILYSLSDYVRVGGKGADELTQNAKKAGYDGIKVGDETVIFDPKNIRSSGAAFNPKKSDSSKLMAGIALPVAGAGAMSMQEEYRGLGSIPPRQ